MSRLHLAPTTRKRQQEEKKKKKERKKYRKKAKQKQVEQVGRQRVATGRKRRGTLKRIIEKAGVWGGRGDVELGWWWLGGVAQWRGRVG